mmetsp:Transcript_12193/g.19145  ORF Transcript_12193/g.19145 Transcript_12193/m.19145 type:complete len:250 (+) Transcript_12193:342-1091(+)
MTAEMLAVDIGQEDAAGVLKFIRRRMEQGRWRSSLDHKRSVEEAGLGTSWYNGTLAPKLSAPQLLKRHATEERVLNFKETSNGSEALAPPTSSLAAGTPGTPGVERSGGPDQDLSRGVAVPGKIVIRNLPPNTREWDVREEFHKRDLPEPLNIDVILNKEYNTRTGFVQCVGPEAAGQAIVALKGQKVTDPEHPSIVQRISVFQFYDHRVKPSDFGGSDGVASHLLRHNAAIRAKGSTNWRTARSYQQN